MTKAPLFRLLFLFCFLLPAVFFAQPGKIDSLKKLLAREEQDTERVNVLNSLAWNLRVADPATAGLYAKQAQELAQKLHFEPGLANSYSHQGVLAYRQGDLAKAVDFHFQALRIREKIGDRQGIAISDINLANIYGDQKNYDQALHYYAEAEKISVAAGDSSRLATLYLNIGAVYLQMKNNDRGLEYCRKAQVQAHATGNSNVEGFAWNNIGIVEESMKNYDDALKAYQQAYKIGENNGDKTVMVDAAVNIGNTWAEKNDFATALSWHAQAAEMAGSIQYADGLRSAYEGLSGDYESTGKYSQALLYYKRYKTISDSLFNEQNSQQIAEMQMRFEFERKEIEEKRLEMEQQKLAASMFREGGLVIWVAIGAVVFFVFLGFMIYAFQRIRSLKYSLEVQQEIVNRQMMSNQKNRGNYPQF